MTGEQKTANEKQLPVYTPLAATSRPQIDILSIFDESDENMIWFITYFLSLSMLKGGDTLLFADETSSVSLFNCCPMIDSFTYDLGTIREKWGTFSNFVADRIDKGYYVYAWSDIYYIEAYKLHHAKNHIMHPMLIYGYNGSGNVVYGQDFFEYALAREAIPTDQIESAVKNLSPGFRVTCFKKGRYNNQIEIKSIMRALHCHLESKSIYEDSIFSLNRNANRFTFGIGCYYGLQNTIRRSMLVGCEEINHHTCHAIPDHINILIALVRYLRGQNPLLVPEAAETNKLMQGLADKSLVYQNLCLKYNATKNKNILGRIADMLSRMKEEEEAMLRSIYGGIDSYFNENAHLFPQYFDDPGGLMYGFIPMWDIAEKYLYDGNVLYTVTGDDPVLMNQSVAIDATAMKYIYITLSSGCESETAQIFFASTKSNAGRETQYAITEENSVSFTYSPRGDVITYALDMSCCENWDGTVYILRLDPAVFNNKNGKGELRIMSFEVNDALPVYGSVRDFCGRRA